MTREVRVFQLMISIDIWLKRPWPRRQRVDPPAPRPCWALARYPGRAARDAWRRLAHPLCGEVIGGTEAEFLSCFASVAFAGSGQDHGAPSLAMMRTSSTRGRWWQALARAEIRRDCGRRKRRKRAIADAMPTFASLHHFPKKKDEVVNVYIK